MTGHSRRSLRRRLRCSLTQIVQDIWKRKAGADPDEIELTVDEAWREVRRATRLERRKLSRPRRASSRKGRQ